MDNDTKPVSAKDLADALREALARVQADNCYNGTPPWAHRFGERLRRWDAQGGDVALRLARIEMQANADMARIAEALRDTAVDERDAALARAIQRAECLDALAAAEAAEAEVARLRSVKDGAYRERNQCVIGLARLAALLGWRVGTMPHTGADWEDDWRTLLFIDLPTGQVTWHFHDSEKPLLDGFVNFPRETWDGHNTAEKYRRLAALSGQRADDLAARLAKVEAELVAARGEAGRLAARVAELEGGQT